jgi:hypothetical protein
MTQRRFLLRDLVWGGMLVGLLIAPALVPLERALPAAPVTVVQAQAPARGAAPTPVVVSPEVRPDRRVTFRILAPEAQKVDLRSPGDIPGVGGRGVAS